MANIKTLRYAIKAGDIAALEDMLRSGLKAELRLRLAQWTPLHLAAKTGKPEVISLFLKHGADINAESELRETPLDIAEHFEHKAAADVLRKHGGKNGVELSLHGAAVAGDLKWVKKHVSSGANIDELNRGESPLCLALECSHWDVAVYLLRKKPDVRKAQGQGFTALHIAARRHADESILNAILKLGAEIDGATESGQTPLCSGALAGDQAAVEFLIANGANVNPIHGCALEKNHDDIARLLIEKGAKATLHEAVECGHLPMARKLLVQGANLEAKDGWREQTPLFVAIENQDAEMAELLLDFGADVNAQLPSHYGRESMFGGEVPLHRAVYLGSAKLVKLLLSHGADPDIADAKGLSPLEVAKRRDQTHLVHLMEAHIDKQLSADKVEQLFTMEKVAQLLSVDLPFVAELLKQGKLRQVKLAASTMRIPASSISRYVAAAMR